MRNTAWTVVGATRRGRPVPPRARQASLAVFTASRQLSVPPEVAVPATSGPAWKTPRAKSSSSRSITATEPNAVGSSPFTGCIARIAAAASSSRSARPESYT
ncbi:MAG: hypothetical protein LCH96_02445 [Actinobacteria bacterium]|nr:hypothetical protein [Actinomycetota bacterium]